MQDDLLVPELGVGAALQHGARVVEVRLLQQPAQLVAGLPQRRSRCTVLRHSLPRRLSPLPCRRPVFIFLYQATI